VLVIVIQQCFQCGLNLVYCIPVVTIMKVAILGNPVWCDGSA